MLVGMRHTAVLVLGCVAVALVVACGGTPQPTPTPTLDVEATVEAAEDVETGRGQGDRA
mgnify:CR=1 FL=1